MYTDIEQLFITKFNNLEGWIDQEDFSSPIPKPYFQEVDELIKEGRDAVDYYRNELMYLISKISGHSGLYDDIGRILKDIQNANPTGFVQIMNHYGSDNKINRFKKKRDNAMSVFEDVNGRFTITTNNCFALQSYFEIDSLLELFTSLFVLHTTGNVDLNLLGYRYPTGGLKKGKCIKYIERNTVNYQEFVKVFQEAYNSGVRNLIGHNDYEIKEGMLVSLQDPNISYSEQEFIDVMYNLQNINNALVNTMSQWLLRPKVKTLDCKGILAFGYVMYEDGPELIIYQLACFNCIDPNLEWASKIRFNIEGDELVACISDTSTQRGSLRYEIKDWLRYHLNNELSVIKVQLIGAVPEYKEGQESQQLKFGKFQPVLVRNLEIPYVISEELKIKLI